MKKGEIDIEVMTEGIYRTLIVDDERLARERLKALLEDHPQVRVVNEAENVKEAVDALSGSEVDLIFLDIQMPGGNGFDLFDRFDVRSEVVFVTAHDDFAIRAFEVNALDYLLKPISKERLKKTLDNLEERNSGSKEPAEATLKPSDKICLRNGMNISFVEVREIAAILAEGDYCDIYLKDGCNHLVGDRLASFEKRLGGSGFFRIHRGTLINLGELKEVIRQDGSSLVRVRGVEKLLPVSRRRLALFKKTLEQVAVPVGSGKTK